MQAMSATKFKAQCLAILDEVATTGETVTILKCGKPVAQLVPPAPTAARYPQEELFGTVVLHGDVVGPVLPADVWDAERPYPTASIGTQRTASSSPLHELWERPS